MLKVIYISYPNLLDFDLPLIKNLSKLCNLYYYLDVSPYNRDTNVLSIAKWPSNPDIYTFRELDSDHNYLEFLDYDKSFIINRSSNKSWSISNISMQMKLFKRIRRSQPDIMHLNNPLTINNLFLLIHKNSKRLLTLHDPSAHSGEYNFRSELYKKINFKKTNAIILLNRYLTDGFINKYKLERSKIFSHPLGIYEFLIQYRDPAIETEDSTILFFGRISPYKGIEYLIEASKIVKKSIPTLKVIIAGKGKLYFNNLTMDSSIKIINRALNNQELAVLIQKSAMVVCPYIDATQSGVIMTAYAFNKPVVASNIGGLPESVKDGITGKLVKPRCIESLAIAITELLSNPQMRKRIEQNIYTTYHSGEQTWNRIAQTVYRIYTDV